MAPNGFIEELKTQAVREGPAELKKNERIGTSDSCDKQEKVSVKGKWKWRNIIPLAILHTVSVIAVLTCGLRCRILTYVFGVVTAVIAGLGVTGGAHRLWTHRSYKAKWPLRLFLVCCYAMAGQNPLFDWVRDHRVHHKYSETDADPHNAARGFFFAHVGWLLQKKHPEVIKKGRQVDMSDVMADPVVVFYQKYYFIFQIVFCFVIPVAIPYYLWNEDLLYSFLAIGCVRYVCGLNFTWLVNSAAHIYGNRPYDKRISPTENYTVSLLAMGEGWHNYHHVFPWDYKAAELGNNRFNPTTGFLNFCAKLGLAYDMKEPSKELVMRIAEKYGDGTLEKHEKCPSTHEVDETGKVTNCCSPEEDEALKGGLVEVKYKRFEKRDGNRNVISRRRGE